MAYSDEREQVEQERLKTQARKGITNEFFCKTTKKDDTKIYVRDCL